MFLNDYFVRYLFSDKGSEAILLDFINSIMLDSGMKTFRSAEILTPFNYKENYEDKETIAPKVGRRPAVKCITQMEQLLLYKFSCKVIQDFQKEYYIIGLQIIVNF